MDSDRKFYIKYITAKLPFASDRYLGLIACFISGLPSDGWRENKGIESDLLATCGADQENMD